MFAFPAQPPFDAEIQTRLDRLMPAASRRSCSLRPARDRRLFDRFMNGGCSIVSSDHTAARTRHRSRDGTVRSEYNGVCTSHFLQRAPDSTKFSRTSLVHGDLTTAAVPRIGWFSNCATACTKRATCLTPVVALAAHFTDAAIHRTRHLVGAYTRSYLTKALHLRWKILQHAFFTLMPTHDGPFHEPIRPPHFITTNGIRMAVYEQGAG